MRFGFLKRMFFGLFDTQEKLSEKETQRASRMLVVDGGCSMAMGTLQGGPFLAAFAVALGASNYEIGLLASIAFLNQPMQLLGLYLVKRFRMRRAITVICAGFSRLLWLLIILIPFLFVSGGSAYLIQWLFLAGLVGAIPGPAWNSLLRDVVPKENFGKLFSKRMIVGTGLAIVLTLGGGFFVDGWKAAHPEAGLYAYSWLFFLGFLFGAAGVIAIARIPEPKMLTQSDASLVELLKMPVRDSNYRRLLNFVAIWNFAINMATPFFVIYMLKRIEIPLSIVTGLTVLSLLTNMLFFRIWGRLADRFSNKAVLAVSGPLFLIAVLAWCFTTMPEHYILTIPILCLIHVLSGMSMAGVSLTTANIALKLSPDGYAHAYMTIFGLVGAVTGAAAPLLGGIFADFFATRELSLAINWSDPARQLMVYAVNFRALDFLFLFSFLVGLYALQHLASVREEGEVTEGEVLDELINEVAVPFKAVSSTEGILGLAAFPLRQLKRVIRSKKK